MVNLFTLVNFFAWVTLFARISLSALISIPVSFSLFASVSHFALILIQFPTRIARLSSSRVESISSSEGFKWGSIISATSISEQYIITRSLAFVQSLLAWVSQESAAFFQIKLVLYTKVRSISLDRWYYCLSRRCVSVIFRTREAIKALSCIPDHTSYYLRIAYLTKSEYPRELACSTAQLHTSSNFYSSDIFQSHTRSRFGSFSLIF